MNMKFILFLLLGLDATILLLETSDISISYNEALLLYGDSSLLQFITKFFMQLLGQNDLAFRLIMILLHLASALLIYLISKRYLSSQRNQLWLLLIFILLPGVISSALIVNHAGILIFGLLLYIYLSEIVSLKYSNTLLFLLVFVDAGFSYLFLGLALYMWIQKNRAMFSYNLGLFILSILFFGIKIDGSPSGHFLDILGIYSAIFTPIVFIYLFYILYKRYLTNKIDKLWYISTVAFVISLFLSFRQRIDIEVFAPYLIVSLPLAAQSFVSSYRVRLKRFRTKYRFVFTISLLFLLLNALVVFFNKELYLLLKNPQKHFAYDMHIAKDLAKTLRLDGYKCVKTDYKMQLRLRFYGIGECDSNILNEIVKNEPHNVTISYRNKTLYSGIVTKLNK